MQDLWRTEHDKRKLKERILIGIGVLFIVGLLFLMDDFSSL